VLLLSFIVRIRLIDAPLERDEGEHAYLAQTLLQGHAPWSVAYNMKLPGTDICYALALALGGQNPASIRVELLILNTLTIALIWILGTMLLGNTGGAVSAACYGLLSMSQNVLGTIAHSTHFVVFFALIGLILILKSRFRPSLLFLSGIAFGFAFMMKQPGIAFAAFAACYLLWEWRRSRTPFPAALKGLTIFAAGVLLPYGLLCLALWKAGVFSRFWFWTVTLAQAFATQRSLADQYALFTGSLSRVLGPNIFLWLVSLLGIALACSLRATRRSGYFCAVFMCFSALAVSAGGSFNPHYYILLLPAAALGAGAFVSGGEQAESLRSRRHFTSTLALVLFAACAFSVLAQRNYLFAMTPYEFERNSYQLNPFPEAVVIGDYIRSHSKPGARIAVIGSEAEIYFYARRPAATGYIFTYGLMETHRYADPMQGEMIGEIESARPEYLVLVGIAASWLSRPESSRTIFGWSADYANRHFDPVGVVELRSQEPTVFVWGPEARSYTPTTPAYLLVYRRKKE
jgi:hypothetical protein